MVYRDRINKVIEVIGNDNRHHPTLNELSAIAGFSPYHFHRIFSAFVGESLGEYIRRMRLSTACHELIHSRKTITDIALSSGYETPAAFSKAFRKQFCVNPSQVRSTGRPPVIPSQTQIKSKRSRNMKPEIRSLPDLRIYYATARGSINQDFTKAADQAFTLLCRFVDEHQLAGHIDLCMGISPDDPDAIPADQQRYEAAYVFTSGITPPTSEKVKSRIIPAGKYAVFLHQGPYSTLWQTWNAIYRDWLPASRIELRDHAPFEVYLDDKWKTDHSKLRTEIFIPIK